MLTHPPRSLLGAYLGFLTAKLGFLLLLVVETGPRWLWHLGRFDAGWYLTIIQDGYQATEPGTRSNLAFFPLFPTLAGMVSSVGIPPSVALLVVAWCGSLAAVAGIWALGREVADGRVGMWMVLLWAVAPRAHVQVMGYSEGPFTALVAFCLLGVVQRRWVLAGVTGVLAGLMRPSVAPLILTMGVVWLVGVVRARRRGEGWRESLVTPPLVVTLLSGFAMVSVMAFVAIRTGSPAGYFAVQAEWNQHLGTPLQTLSFFLTEVVPNPRAWPYFGIVGLFTAGYQVLFWWMVIRRERWELLVFTGLSLLLVLCQQNYYASYARFLLPLFPLWLPVARIVARRPLFPMLLVWSVIMVAGALAGTWGIQLRHSP